LPIKTQQDIIDAIQSIGEDISVRRYYGELSTPSQPLLSDGELPLILVDFVGDKPLSISEVQLTFNLYIAHVSLSKNRHTRQKKHEEVLILLNQIDKSLSLALTDNTSLLLLGSLKKIFDAKSDKGYLTIYMRQIHTTTTRNYHLDRQPTNL